jgi:hypothetical protein
MIRFIAVIIALYVWVCISYSDPLYYEATYRDKDPEQAELRARADIAQQIQSIVSVCFQDILTEENLEIKSEFTSLQSISYSNVILRNVNVFRKKKLFHWEVTVRVTKRDVDQAFSERKYHIRSLITAGNLAFEDLSLSEAIRNYYWAYLLSFSYPDTVGVSLPNDFTGNARAVIPTFLRRMLSDIEVSTVKCWLDREYLVVDLSASYRSQPIGYLYCNYYTGSGNDIFEIINGSGLLILPAAFNASNIIVQPLVEFAFAEEMAGHTEVTQIWETLMPPEFQRNLPINIDVLPFLSMDISLIVEDGSVFFAPIVEQITIACVHWDFGDGFDSDLPEPVHTYDKPGRYRITMTLNDDPVLQACCVFDSQTELLSDCSDSKPQFEEGLFKNTTPEVLFRPVENDDLFDCLQLTHFNELLQLGARAGDLVYGRGEDFEQKNGLFLFIFSPQGVRQAIYHYENSLHHRLNSSLVLDSLQGEHPGGRGIWVEIINEDMLPSR